MTIRPFATLTFAAAVGAFLVASAGQDGGSSPFRRSRVRDITMPAAGSIVERRIGRGEAHRYRVSLAAGEYAGIVVEQIGIDLSVRTSDPGGSPIAEYDDDPRPFGEERVDLVASKPGTYTVLVQPPSRSVQPASYTIRIDARREATGVERSRQQSRLLQAEAARLQGEGRFGDARLRLEQALAAAVVGWGARSENAASVDLALGSVYRDLPDASKAEAAYGRAIEIFDALDGNRDPRSARARAGLASLYEREGEARKAEALLEPALTVFERSLGAGHPWIVSSLITLGDLREDAGDIDAEEAILRRAIAIVERADDVESYQYAALLNNLGEVYRHRQEYARAEALLHRSLALTERVLGPDAYLVATPLQNLGIVARERKDYAAAVACNERALALRERGVGPDHPAVAHVLTNLANIYRATGDYRKALDTHLRALRIWENAAGPYQDATLLSVGNIAKTYAAENDVAHAIAYERRADAIVEKRLALNLAVGSERQKLTFVRSVAERTDRTLSLHLEQAPADPAAASLAAEVLLQRKGRVQDAMADTFGAIRDRVATGPDRVLLDSLEAATTALAHFALAPPGARGNGGAQRLADLEAERERLEAALSARSSEFRARRRPVTLRAVEAAIPADAALLEFAVFRPFDPRAERNAEAYGPPRYAAYVVRPAAPPVGVDLGPTAEVDRSIGELRDALRDPRDSRVIQYARTVERELIEPLSGAIDGVERLIVSPDGDLNLIPFEALVDGNGRFLIERHAITYVTSGRDLLRMQVPRASHGTPVIVVDPLFGDPAAAPVHVASATAGESSRVAPGDSLSRAYFAPLPALAGEGRAIKGFFPDAVLFTGAAATKTALQRVRAPLLLHIGSHGFFLENSDAADVNPLLRSGLALAGANIADAGRREGILTALEASGLDLWGTKLVTLSACDTGVGEIRNGEGVYGLRRAFVLAGAETLVMSLWPVSDAVARDTMVAYYSGLRAGLGRGDALRRTKLAILRRPGHRHPYYWGAFILSGEWAGLNGRR